MALGRRETPSPIGAADRKVELVDDAGGKLLELELWQLEQPYAELRIRTPKQLARMAASLLEEGQRSPLVVVAGTEASHYVLIDGHSRVRAMRRTHDELARVLWVPLEAAEALGWSYRLETGPRRTALEEGWLVRELMLAKRSLGEVAELVGRSKSWVSRRRGLVDELPEAIQFLVRTGGVSAHAAMKSLLPLARATAEAAVALGEAARREELTSRQLEVLCRGWHAASGVERERLVAEPRLYLEVMAKFGKAGKNERPALVRDFELLGAVARRSERVLRHGDDEESGAREALAVVWPRTEHALESLAVTVEEVTDAGLGHTSGDPTTAS
jgi:ParB-like chromosome segregation protein Spo0J